MGKRTSYAPGTFSWVDLGTTDVTAATRFYEGLFGWETSDEDAGGGAVYTMCRVDGDAVGGLYQTGDDMPSAGGPPCWTSYVTVAGADDALDRARKLGGGAMAGAFDVMDLGRMAVLTDPQGASFAVWEPRQRAGADRVNDVGCLCMNELATTDLDGARSFYEALFGWSTSVIDTGPGGPAMASVQNGGRLNANMSVAQGGAPAHWRPYFTVVSATGAVHRVGELGGSVLMPPLTVPAGSFALVQDPQGALLGLFEGEVDP